MRVIAGEARGRKLKPVPGTGTRPVTDRVKESLFDILAGDVQGAAFLDLFAGTGGVAIEALSRGAASATLVERAPAAVAVIRENLRTTGLAHRATVVQADVFRFLEAAQESFAIVHVAPPQYRGLWVQTLKALDREDSPAADLVVVQIHPKEYEPVGLAYFELEDERRYGSTLLCFYHRIGDDEESE